MASANPKVTQVVPDDGPGFMIGMVLFTVLIPFLFGLSWYLSPLGDERPAVHGPTAPAAPAAEAAPEAPAAP